MLIKTMPLLFFTTKLSTYLCHRITFSIHKRYYPGAGDRKIRHVRKVLSSYNRFSKYSSLSTTNNRFMSKKYNPHFRNLREKVGLCKNNPHLERSRDVRIHNYRKTHRHYESNNMRTKLRSKHTIDTTINSSNNLDKNTPTLQKNFTQNIAHNSTEPSSFSPLKMVTKNVKIAYNSLFVNKSVNPSLLRQEPDFEESSSRLISPDINLQVTSYNTTQLPISSHISALSEQPIKLILSSLSENTSLSIKNEDSYQEKLIYFKDKIISAGDNIMELKKVCKELNVYCQNVFDNNVQVYTKDNFQNNSVLSLLKTKYFSEPWTTQLQEHLSQPMEKSQLTIKNMEDQLLILNRGFNILNKYGSQLPEAISLKFMRYHNILKNNDAVYTQDDIGVSVGKKNIVQRYGEGFTLHDRVYKYMFAHPDAYCKIYRETPLTKNESLQIDTKIKTGDFFVKTANLHPHIIQEHYSGILMGSGDVIHNIICVTIVNETGKIFDIGINSFTSSKDQGTIYLGCKQIINNEPNEQNKDQYCRPFRQAIYIPENNYITKNDKFTEFATSTNFKGLGINLREKIYQEFIKKRPSLEKMPIRMIQEITQPFLYVVASNLIMEDIMQQQNEYNKFENSLKNLSDKDKTIKLQKRENSLKNVLKDKIEKKYIKTSPKAFQDLILIKNKLETTIEFQTKISKENNKNK